MITNALCRWFDRHARELPWRLPSKRTGYSALVAETMLQQTQVSRVIERYRAFLKRFPTVRALAKADEQEVLAMWQGMGYYRRAQNLHRAARMIVSEFKGRVPRSVEQLLGLPGVGRYTAGAIASIVYGRHEPIVDGNVNRVLARFFAPTLPSSERLSDQESTTENTESTEKNMNNFNSLSVSSVNSVVNSSESPAALYVGTLQQLDPWKIASHLVKHTKRPGVFNEAMMELGATICTPRAPKCDSCPLAKWCEAKRQGMQHEIPYPKQRVKPQVVHHHAVVITRNGKVLIEQRSDLSRASGSNRSRMWAGMWQTPTIESDRRLDLIEIKQSLPIAVLGALTEVGSFDHHTTHRRIRFHIFHARSNARRGDWRGLDDLIDVPMSNAQRRVLGMAKEY